MQQGAGKRRMRRTREGGKNIRPSRESGHGRRREGAGHPAEQGNHGSSDPGAGLRYQLRQSTRRKRKRRGMYTGKGAAGVIISQFHCHRLLTLTIPRPCMRKVFLK